MRTHSSRYSQEEIIRCAWLYYQQDYNQEEIARRLGMSRARVVRLLKEARTRGLVQIRINAAVDLFEREEAVQQRYHACQLRRVRLVPTVTDEDEQRRLVAHELPSLLTLGYGDIIAVSWGRTLSYALDLLPAQPALRLTVVSALGGIQGGTHTANPYDVAFRLGQRLHARAVYTLQAPALVRDPETAALLLREESLQETLALAARAQVALFSGGDLSDSSTLERLNAISREERLWLRAKGAVGDLLCHFLDRQGRVIDLEGRLTTVALPLLALKAIPERICLAAGGAKQEIVLAMLRGGFITTLITDEATADYLLSQEPGAASFEQRC
ncbi:sugar-binding transcriptional regulator [Thermogemmatispora sp.]|uniref:sugar-binding transcriptional regulator n=1 Tax=Thermogemmatispora sp. TaxID=1968838 RepID=UPI001D56424D|nr:sugar-binding transcriptional regulator [Thermogemmatispora sp.]MBX5448961.1 sugar-binding transcriptional regulator [Thermogemmatispora sp.]